MKKKVPQFWHYFFPLIITLMMVAGVGMLTGKNARGFSLSKIRSSLEFNEEWVVDAPSNEIMEEIRDILGQEFHYLGNGTQCYAFLSKDGEYVLKFFKMKHLMPKNWLRFFPIPGLGQYRFNKTEGRIARRKQIFTSHKMAYKYLREETGLIFVHLNKTRDLGVTTALCDRFGQKLQVRPDQLEFILQRKATPITEHIDKLMKTGRVDEAKSSIRTLLRHVVNKSKRGFLDKDFNPSHNYGFVGNQIIHYDVGQIVQDDDAVKPSHYLREVLRVSTNLEQWLAINYPELLPTLEEDVGEWIDQEQPSVTIRSSADDEDGASGNDADADKR